MLHWSMSGYMHIMHKDQFCTMICARALSVKAPLKCWSWAAYSIHEHRSNIDSWTADQKVSGSSPDAVGLEPWPRSLTHKCSHTIGLWSDNLTEYIRECRSASVLWYGALLLLWNLASGRVRRKSNRTQAQDEVIRMWKQPKLPVGVNTVCLHGDLHGDCYPATASLECWKLRLYSQGLRVCIFRERCPQGQQ